MCSTSSPPTAFTGGPIRIEGTPPPGTAGAVQPLTPFAAIEYPKPDITGQDDTLRDKLKAAITHRLSMLGGANQKVAWSMLCFTTTGGVRYAGVDDDKLHFSASLLKVAAMYAAHELLAAANRLARTPGPHTAKPTPFFAELKTRFDDPIKLAARPNVLTAANQLVTKLGTYRATPSYEMILDASGVGGPPDPPPIKFDGDFLTRMTNMIELSDDPDAGECIRRLSYTYINAALMKAGLYEFATNDGIWLAGDYTKGGANNPRAETESVYDHLVAQATTTRKMARVFALIEKGLLVSQDNNHSSMRHLLALAASHGGFFRDYNPPPPNAKPFTLVLSKIGIAPLKTGQDVVSEGQLLHWIDAAGPAAKNLKQDFVVCWQNLRPDLGGTVGGIVEVFRETFKALL